MPLTLERPRAGRLTPGRTALLVAAWLVVQIAVASAQPSFRVTHEVDRSTPDRTRVTGSVQNDGRVDVHDVYVTVEAVDGAGKVVARGIAFVSPHIRQGGRAPFEAVVPAGGAPTFRVRVTGYRVGLGASESP